MLVKNATEVRHNWSATVDDVVRDRPQFIKRTRDYLLLSNLDTIKTILDPYNFHADEIVEKDGSITLSLQEIDLVENAVTRKQAKAQLAQSLLNYAEDYYKEFSYWSTAPNRKSHIPYVLKALILNDISKIGDLIQCRHGKN